MPDLITQVRAVPGACLALLVARDKEKNDG